MKIKQTGILFVWKGHNRIKIRKKLLNLLDLIAKQNQQNPFPTIINLF